VTERTPALPLPSPLQDLIEEHGARFAPQYPPSGNSDHGPMTYLACYGLGLPMADINAFAKRYCRRLAEQLPYSIPDSITEANWTKQVGQASSYVMLRSFFCSRIERDGWQSVLSQYLPQLLSGWATDAYHAMIRLGYAVEFELPTEMSSALAYMTILGPNPQLEATAHRAPSAAAAHDCLLGSQASRQTSYRSGRFNDRLSRILAEVDIRPTGARTTEDLSRLALAVFDATHDFFALHLVTASHAFRLCEPYTGALGHALYDVGIAAGYVAIGAPDFTPLDREEGTIPLHRLSLERDEHCVKFAYTARQQAAAFHDPTYQAVASRYLVAQQSKR
jgi:hypothetical protein